MTRLRKVTSEMEKLEPRKAAYVRGGMDGKSKKQAALDAGYSGTMAEHAADKIETRDVQEVFARVIREIIPPEFIAKGIAEGTHREAVLIDDGGIMRCSVCKFPFDPGIKPSLTVAFVEHLFKAKKPVVG